MTGILPHCASIFQRCAMVAALYAQNLTNTFAVPVEASFGLRVRGISSRIHLCVNPASVQPGSRSSSERRCKPGGATHLGDALQSVC